MIFASVCFGIDDALRKWITLASPRNGAHDQKQQQQQQLLSLILHNATLLSRDLGNCMKKAHSHKRKHRTNCVCVSSSSSYHQNGNKTRRQLNLSKRSTGINSMISQSKLHFLLLLDAKNGERPTERKLNGKTGRGGRGGEANERDRSNGRENGFEYM